MATYPSASTSVTGAASAKANSGGQKLTVIDRTYDLDTLISGKLANTDIVNLGTLPANFVVLATLLKTTVVSVGGSSTCTLKLRFGTTDIGAATDILTTATGTGGGATVALPLNVGTSDALLNVVCALGGGTTTKNPTIRVVIVGVDMST